jgi:tripartite-type tricarboxylate transporter receptor subunit TctC
MSRMRALGALVLACAASLSAAQEFPARTVHLIVPFTPGTGADLLARMLGPRLAERWKVAVVTENKAGATGNIGADFVARSAPDGHTLLFVATSFGTAPALSKTLPFDPVKSFAPVALVATSALLVVTHPALPARSVPDLVKLAKREPGKFHYSSPGSGGPQHLAMELLKLETGMDIVHVPYKGSAGALADVVSGHVQVTIAGLQTAQPHVRSGRLRALAVMSAARASAFPDVATLAEQGLRELEVETWYGVFAPAGTSPRVLAKINADLNALLNDAAVRDAVEKQAMAPAGGAPGRLGELLKHELARWTRVVNAAGIKAD